MNILKITLCTLLLLNLTSCDWMSSSSEPIKNKTALDLPPEPDETENNKTLKGIDSNGDGVRDDIERYIKLNETDVNLQRALLEFAKFKTGFYDIKNENEAKEFSVIDDKNFDCFYSLMYKLIDKQTNKEEKSTLFNKYSDKLTNVVNLFYYSSLQRVVKFHEIDQLFSGFISYNVDKEKHPKEYCNFEIQGE